MGDPVGCGYGSETEIVVSTLRGFYSHLHSLNMNYSVHLIYTHAGHW
jgi:hypothetical protein